MTPRTPPQAFYRGSVWLAVLHHVASRVNDSVKDQRTTRSSRPLHLLVVSLRDGVLDLSLAQPPSAARIAVALVGDDAVRAPPRASSPAGSRDADAVEDRHELGAVMAMPRRDHDRERPTLPVAGQVELGRQPSGAASQPFVRRVLDPLLFVGATRMPAGAAGMLFVRNARAAASPAATRTNQYPSARANVTTQCASCLPL
jgi:hypothetical protein